MRAELQLLLDDLAEVERMASEPAAARDEVGAAGPLGLVIARLARRAIAAGYVSETELGRMVLEAGRTT